MSFIHRLCDSVMGRNLFYFSSVNKCNQMNLNDNNVNVITKDENDNQCGTMQVVIELLNIKDGGNESRCCEYRISAKYD